MATSRIDPYSNISFEVVGGDAPAPPSATASSPAPDEGATEYEIGVARREEQEGSSPRVAIASMPGLRRTRPKGRRVRDNYLVEYTVGSIIRTAFKIYLRYFGTLFLIYVLPVVPVAMIFEWARQSGGAWQSGDIALVILASLVYFFVVFFAYGATTVAVSDVCLGNTPSVRRSYARIFSRLLLLLLVTNVLSLLTAAVGLVLLVIPGLTLLIWLLLSPSVVVLERKSGVSALKRSKQLADGSHWRNAGLFLLLTMIVSVIVAVLQVVIVVVAAVLFPQVFSDPMMFSDPMIGWFLITVSTITSHGLYMPVYLIALVLVYYDRRVRKEGYDAKALAEDLER